MPDLRGSAVIPSPSEEVGLRDGPAWLPGLSVPVKIPLVDGIRSIAESAVLLCLPDRDFRIQLRRTAIGSEGDPAILERCHGDVR